MFGHFVGLALKGFNMFLTPTEDTKNESTETLIQRVFNNSFSNSKETENFFQTTSIVVLLPVELFEHYVTVTLRNLINK